MNCSSAIMESIMKLVFRPFFVVILFTFCISREAHAQASESVPRDSCPISYVYPVCDEAYPYRSFDGSCNNLINTAWGQSRRPQIRLLPYEYAKGSTEKIRNRGVNDRVLPSTRKVTTTLLTLASEEDLDKRYTTMHMLWGQITAHEMTHVRQVDEVHCCPGEQWAARNRDRNCIPLQMSRNDPFWGKNARSETERSSCMEMRRSESVEPGMCFATSREQINNVTSFIDAGVVYGSKNETSLHVRLFNGGLLEYAGNGTLPNAPENIKCDIPSTDPDKKCLIAGDTRLHVWTGLLTIHEVFLRSHNRIASDLYGQVRAKNPNLSLREIDEITFQETRRIIVAIMQVITFGEYLPLVIGEAQMQKYGLHLQSKSRIFRSSYDSSVNPTLSNVFATAAFRFGHGTIPFGVQPKSSTYENSSSFVTMEDMFNQPSTFRREGYEGMVRGIIRCPMLERKGKFVQDIRDKTFSKTFDGLGFDLPAKNTQRGREQGIPPYMKWREYCGLPQTLEDHSPMHRRKLRGLYNSDQDIDLFPGAMSEISVAPEAAVGPTFACLIGREFQRVKSGDRFWFENQNSYANPFSSQQIAQLSQVTLSKMICDAIPGSQQVPQSSFLTASPLVDCSSLPGLNLNNWI